jgi:CRISPR system Cascade subunit CasE
MFESLVRFTPRDPAQAARVMYDRGHRLVWMLFAQHGVARDFLYQPIPGYPFSAVVRSSRPPQVVDGWSVTTRAFAPHLKAGQALGFRLEAVPFRWKPLPGARRGQREDLVTAVRRAHPEARQDPDLEAALVRTEALRWFAQQGAKQGFSAASKGLAVSVYNQEIRGHERASRGQRFRFTSFVYEGRLQVTDSEKFRVALERGVGAEKAFGFGLMQIAPVPASEVAV